MNKIPTAIIDLDNCISDDKWRWPLFDLHLPLPNDRYARYHAACWLDLPHNQHVLNELERQYQFVIFTARPERVRRMTSNWLDKWQIPVSQLLMRPDKNHESSVIVKKRMLIEWLLPRYDVQYAIDDRIDILNMYADEGVRTCQRVFINAPEIEHP